MTEFNPTLASWRSVTIDMTDVVLDEQNELGLRPDADALSEDQALLELHAIADFHGKVKSLVDAAERLRKDANNLLAQIETRSGRLFTTAGVPEIVTRDNEVFKPNQTESFSYEEGKELKDLLPFLRANYPDKIKVAEESVHPQSRDAILRDEIKRNQGRLPEELRGIIKVTPFTKIVRKAK